MPADRGQGWATWAIAGMAAVAVVAGLALVGGPAQGRKERRDETRERDLSQLSRHVGCLAGDGALPADLGDTDRCPGPIRRDDPFTGAPYRFEPLPDRAYRLCAAFELPKDTQPGQFVGAPQRVGDCIQYSLRPLRAD